MYDGGIDGLVAIYFITTSYCIYEIFFSRKNENNNPIFIFSTFLFCVSLSLLKNEGFALLVLIFLTASLVSLFEKKLLFNLSRILILCFSFIPFIVWKIFCYKNGISNTDFTFSLLNENLLERLVVLENFLLFFQYLIISNEKVIIALLFFAFSFYFNFNKKLFYFVIFLFSSYLALLLIIYFSTPYDINYHLETSANRVVESLTLLLGFFSLYNLNILNKTS